MNYKTTWGAAGIALASAVALNVSAEAADLGAPPPHASFKDEPILVAPLVWAGPYVGGHLGGAWTHGDTHLWYDYYEYEREDPIKDPHIRNDLDDELFIGGIHAGYNWQADWFVGGVEADIDWAEHVDYLATVRGRFGVAANRWLVYGTAGVAFIGLNFDHTHWLDNGFDNGYAWRERLDCRFDNDEVGWVIGGGVEVKLTPGWSLGVEALYYSFDDHHDRKDNRYLYGEDGYFRYGYDNHIGGDVTVVRGRLSYHFLNGFGRGYDPIPVK